MSVGKEIYDDTASFGRLWVTISAVIATIMGLALIIVGIYVLVKKDAQGISGTVIRVDGDKYGKCQQIDSNNGINNYSCILTVEYTSNGVKTTEDISYYGPNFYITGMPIKISGNSVVDKSIPKWTGGIMIFMGVVVAASAWFYFWAARKYKAVAAAGGVGGMLGLIRG